MAGGQADARLRPASRLDALLLLGQARLKLLDFLRSEEDLDLLSVRGRLHPVGLAVGGEKKLSPTAAPASTPAPSPSSRLHHRGRRLARLCFAAAVFRPGARAIAAPFPAVGVLRAGVVGDGVFLIERLG